MKPRRVMLMIELTTHYPLAAFRRGRVLELMTTEDDIMAVACGFVDQIQANVIRQKGASMAAKSKPKAKAAKKKKSK